MDQSASNLVGTLRSTLYTKLKNDADFSEQQGLNVETHWATRPKTALFAPLSKIRGGVREMSLCFGVVVHMIKPLVNHLMVGRCTV